MAADFAVGGEVKMNGEAGALLARPQRAQPVGQRLRQHRHHAVGKIDRIAALARIPVERFIGAHIMGDVGDGDEDMPAARIVRVAVGLGPYGIVEIARVDAVDGDQRHGAQIAALAERWRAGGGGGGERGVGELGGDEIGVDGEQTDGARRVHGAEALGYPCPRQAEAAPGQHLGQDQLARHGAGALLGRHQIVAARAPVGRLDAPAARRADIVGDEAAEQAPAAGIEHPDGARLIAAVGVSGEPRQNAVTDAERALARRFGRNIDVRKQRVRGLGFHRAGAQFTVGIDAFDFEHADIGQLAPAFAGAAGAAAMAVEQSLFAQLAQDFP